MILRSSDVNCDVGGRFRCHNGGSCNTTDNEFMCVCPAGYTGSLMLLTNEAGGVLSCL